MSNTQNSPSLPCPNCGNTITFDAMALLSGGKIECPNCQAVLTLQDEKSSPTQRIEELEAELARLKAKQ